MLFKDFFHRFVCLEHYESCFVTIFQYNSLLFFFLYFSILPTLDGINIPWRFGWNLYWYTCMNIFEEYSDVLICLCFKICTNLLFFLKGQIASNGSCNWTTFGLLIAFSVHAVLEGLVIGVQSSPNSVSCLS